jgi:hypothetical protein
MDNQDGHRGWRDSLHDPIALATGIRYALAMRNSTWWQMSKAIAMVTLADRSKRRAFISGLLVFILCYFAFGNWVIDDWLMEGLWRMLLYWGFLAVQCMGLILFALFDALAVIGEERTKLGMGVPPKDEESSSD